MGDGKVEFGIWLGSAGRGKIGVAPGTGRFTGEGDLAVEKSGRASGRKGENVEARGGETQRWSGRRSWGWSEMEMEVEMMAGRQSGGGGGARAAAAAAWGRRCCEDVGDVSVAGARSGGSRRGGGGDDGGLTPSSAFHEQPLEMEETPFLSQMMARVCGGGGGPFPSYRAHNGPIGERAHLRPTTHT